VAAAMVAVPVAAVVVAPETGKVTKERESTNAA